MYFNEALVHFENNKERPPQMLIMLSCVFPRAPEDFNLVLISSLFLLRSII